MREWSVKLVHMLAAALLRYDYISTGIKLVACTMIVSSLKASYYYSAAAVMRLGCLPSILTKCAV